MPTKAQKEAVAKARHEEEVDQAEAKGYALGQVVVYEAMWKQLRKDCGTLFANGKDDLAEYVRKQADELKGEAERMRKEYMAQWHPEIPK